MLNMGGGEIILILAVALVVLGPDHLPKVMRTVGKTLGEFRRASTELQRTVHSELSLDEQEKTNIAPAPPSSQEPDVYPELKSFAADSLPTSTADKTPQSNEGAAMPQPISRRAIPVAPRKPHRAIRRKALHRMKDGHTSAHVDSEGNAHE